MEHTQLQHRALNTRRIIYLGSGPGCGTLWALIRLESLTRVRNEVQRANSSGDVVLGRNFERRYVVWDSCSVGPEALWSSLVFMLGGADDSVSKSNIKGHERRVHRNVVVVAAMYVLRMSICLIEFTLD